MALLTSQRIDNTVESHDIAHKIGSEIELMVKKRFNLQIEFCVRSYKKTSIIMTFDDCMASYVNLTTDMLVIHRDEYDDIERTYDLSEKKDIIDLYNSCKDNRERYKHLSLNQQLKSIALDWGTVTIPPPGTTRIKDFIK